MSIQNLIQQSGLANKQLRVVRNKNRNHAFQFSLASQKLSTFILQFLPFRTDLLACLLEMKMAKKPVGFSAGKKEKRTLCEDIF